MPSHSRSQSAVARSKSLSHQPRYIFRQQAVVVIRVPEHRSFSTHVLHASVLCTTLIASYAWIHHLTYAGAPGRIASYFPWG